MALIDDIPYCLHDTLQGSECRVREPQGSIVYSDYRECSDSLLLLPGFNLMPRWFLTSTKPPPLLVCNGSAACRRQYHRTGMRLD